MSKSGKSTVAVIPAWKSCPDNLKHAKTIRDLRQRLSDVISLQSTVTMFNDDRNLSTQVLQSHLATSRHAYRSPIRPKLSYHAPRQTCAVVGSGGILRRSKCGNEIDSYDFIFRSNLPPVAGFEADVGSRTDFTAVNKIALNSLVLHLKDPKNQTLINKNKFSMDTLSAVYGTILWFGFNMTRSHNRISQTKSDIQYLLDHSDGLKFTYAYAVLPIWTRIMGEFWNKTGGTSEGFLSFTVALFLCEKIDIYGFWPFPTDPSGKRVSHHYYNKRSQYNKKKIVMPEENAIFLDLNERGIINLVTSKCQG
ncbi:CMP-N-acetylneuraminate-poly-alpha-2,8-sialyltransferase-like [Ptychodera flava]|uniref:CMP-N-acetylneuraminate-poly-alpha-2, 8-sialyltransferase-like n=1 Tax=Ptychodera flava TaxID=63121 RepID=UPI00396A4BAD